MSNQIEVKQVIKYINRRLAELRDGQYYNDDDEARKTAAGELELVLNRVTGHIVGIRTIDTD